MKKFLRILLIVVLLGLGFFAYKKYMPMTTTETTTGDVQSNSGLVFVHEDWFEKMPVNKETARYEPGTPNDVAECKKNPSNWAVSCDEVQKIAENYVLADYSFGYSGFGVSVLDTSKVIGHEDVLLSGQKEFIMPGIFPYTLLRNMLTTTAFHNRNLSSIVFELGEQRFANVDASRVFISFEGQDGLSPVLNIIIKKGNYLVRISNTTFMSFGFQEPSSPLQLLMQKNYDDQSSISQEENKGSVSTIPMISDEKIIELYTKNIAPNSEYEALLQQTIAQANDRFAIK